MLRSNIHRQKEKVIFNFCEGYNYNDIDGKHFVLLDDTVNTGTTTGALARSIEDNGGIIDGIASLAKGKDHDSNIAVTVAQANELINKYGRQNIEKVINEYGYAKKSNSSQPSKSNSSSKTQKDSDYRLLTREEGTEMMYRIANAAREVHGLPPLERRVPKE